MRDGAGAAGVLVSRASIGRPSVTNRQWSVKITRCGQSCEGSLGAAAVGYHRAHQLLLAEGSKPNGRRTQRVWREEGPRVPQKRQKHSGLACQPCRPDAWEPSGLTTCGYRFSVASDSRWA
jgi:hypothetical protein